MYSVVQSKISVFVFLLLASMTCAQELEEVITEADQPEDMEIIDGVVKRDLLYQSRVIAYPPTREADVPWERKLYRIVDTREKLNLPFRYPLQPFITLLIDGVSSGEIVPFQKDDFENQMTTDEVNSKLFDTDTVKTVDPETYETTIKVVRNDLDPMSIERFRIKEIWYFDEAASRVKQRILGIAPIKAEFADDGTFKYEGPMFWIYYPQAREYLARHRAFVDGNDAAPMTWEQLIEMRMFSSYIIKEMNVHDMRLEDFAELKENPIDRLYASQKIEEELFNFEHDLWSF